LSLTSCSDEPDDPDEPPAGPAPATLSLLDAMPAEQERGLLLFDEEAPVMGPRAWHDVFGTGQVLLRAIADGEQALVCEAYTSAGEGHLRLARIAGVRPSGAPDAQVLRAWREALAASSAEHRSAFLDNGPSSPRLQYDPREGLRSPSYVVLELQCSAGLSAIENVRAKRVPKFTRRHRATLDTSPLFSADEAAYQDQVALAGDFRRALVLRSGAELALTLELPESARYLEFAAGALCGEDPARFAALELEIVVEVAGQPRARTQLVRDPSRSIEDAMWESGRLALDELAGERARFVFRAEGPAGSAMAVAHPRVVCPPERGGRPNLLLVSLDTLRADCLGTYGGAQRNSPRLDALAAEGLVYESARSTAPYTLPAHASLFTGQFPSVHGAERERHSLRGVREGETPFLPALLHASNWTTAAFTAGGFLNPDFGLAEGFDHFSINDPIADLSILPAGPQLTKPIVELTLTEWVDALRATAAYTTRVESVNEWIGAHADRPFFLFVHTYTTHNYSPPAELYEEFCGDRCGSDWGGHSQLMSKLVPESWKDQEHDDVHWEHVRHVYEATVRHADNELGRILDALDANGLREDTLVVVFSDHGEEFFEHGVFGHSRSLYDSLLHVPLIMRGPGIEPARRAEAVSLVDVAPSVLQLFGLETPARMQGQFLPGLSQMGTRRETVFSEVDTPLAHVDALATQEWKLIRDYEGELEWQLYDVSSDPGEQAELSEQQPEISAALQRELMRIRAGLDALGAARASSGETVLSPETLQALRDLGYYGDD